MTLPSAVIAVVLRLGLIALWVAFGIPFGV